MQNMQSMWTENGNNILEYLVKECEQMPKGSRRITEIPGESGEKG